MLDWQIDKTGLLGFCDGALYARVWFEPVEGWHYLNLFTEVEIAGFAIGKEAMETAEEDYEKYSNINLEEVEELSLEEIEEILGDELYEERKENELFKD